MPTVEIDLEKDFPELFASTKEMLNFHISNHRYSRLFFFQMMTAQLGFPRKNGTRVAHSDAHEIMQQIDYLEGKIETTNTKGPLPFQDRSISDLMHKHHSSAHDMPVNLSMEFNRHTQRRLANYLNGQIGQKITEDTIKRVAQMAVTEAYEHRASGRQNNIKKGLTGEWIVYKNISGRNFYLFLGYHDMSNAEIREWADRALEDIRANFVE